MIQNPVLPGFHPDPSFVRVGEDYYLATSTFEWFPGVALYHSRDLIHWRPIGHALTRVSQLDLRGVPDSGGIWAPSLSHHHGQFWLVYTIVRTRNGPFKDLSNYLVTTPSIEGPWSEPVYLNSTGFDPSLFHDDDGRKWLVHIQWDFRKHHPSFAGIVLQEYDHRQKKLIGKASIILTKEQLIEGPNLYKRQGWYYLMLAEGGTSWGHGVSMARSRNLAGPYEWDPQPMVVTSRGDLVLPLQKAGHGEIVETPSGEWYLAHLASRPIMVEEERRCILGRETCLQKATWTQDGWLRLCHGGTHPQLLVAPPGDHPPNPWLELPHRDDFAPSALGLQWCSLRIPKDPAWITLIERMGWLRLRGKESLLSLFNQSLIARRLTATQGTAETRMQFDPTHFTQMAGLVCYYDTKTHYYLRATHDEARGKVLGIVLMDDGKYDELVESEITVHGWKDLYLRANFDGSRLQFSASSNGIEWQTVGPILDATRLSDDYGTGLHFTGAFVGLCAQDLNGTNTPADFGYFSLSGQPTTS